MKRLSLVVALLLPSVAQAGEWGVGLRTLGVRIEPPDDEANVNGIGMGGGGAFVRWRFSRHWGIELAGDGMRGTLSGGDYERRTSSLSIAGMFHFTPGC